MKMRKLKVVFILALIILVLASCSSTPSQGEVPLTEAEVPRVSLEEALTAIQNGAAVVVDVRSPEAYAASHIAGAISVPLDEIESNAAGLDLDKDQWIITYCT
ncbi:MAG TPA: rhodanese-like domain-containing protein [Anaerolineales bacterium]|nr:rhodanese-like domain-containing protein [Anaerolineales bacterium]